MKCPKCGKKVNARIIGNMFWYPCYKCKWEKVIDHDEILGEFMADITQV